MKLPIILFLIKLYARKNTFDKKKTICIIEVGLKRQFTIPIVTAKHIQQISPSHKRVFTSPVKESIKIINSLTGKFQILQYVHPVFLPFETQNFEQYKLSINIDVQSVTFTLKV